MNRLRRDLLLLASAALFLMITSLTVAQGTQGPPTRVAGMLIQLSLDKSDIIVGEAVHLTVHVQNENASYRKGNFGARLFLSEGNDIELSVTPPAELPYRYASWEDAAVYNAVEIDLDTNEAMDTKVPLIYERKSPTGYLFDKPGTYVVRAKVNCTILRDPARSHADLVAEVRVRAPDAHAAEAFGILSATTETAFALTKMTGASARAVEAARKVATKYADTPYAPICSLLSINGHLNANPPELDAVVAEARAFLDKFPGDTRAGDAGFLILIGHSRAHHDDLGRDWYYFMRDAFPAYYLLRRENRYAAQYYYGVIDIIPNEWPWWLFQAPWEGPPGGAAPKGEVASASGPSQSPSPPGVTRPTTPSPATR